MNEFTTLEYLISFPGMITAVVLLTQFTKNMFDKLGMSRTKYVVYGWSLLLCIVGAVFLGTFVDTTTGLQTALVWFVNSVVVWFSAMKAFETVIKDVDGAIRIDSSDPQKDIWMLDFSEKTPNMADGRIIKMRIDANADLKPTNDQP